MQESCTVAEYLQARLEQVGCRFVFGVAGNYAAAFLNTIEENPQSKLRVAGNTNEINGGHCADAYARVTRQPAALCVTYGVGAFTGLNPIAGAYVEFNPVLLVNGAPEFGEQQRQAVEGLLYSHMTGDVHSNIDAFRPVTVAAEQVTNAAQAPAKIDAVISTMVSAGRPGYLEVFEDVWRKRCRAPRGELESASHEGCPSNTQAAVDDQVVERDTAGRVVLIRSG